MLWIQTVGGTALERWLFDPMSRAGRRGPPIDLKGGLWTALEAREGRNTYKNPSKASSGLQLARWGHYTFTHGSKPSLCGNFGCRN
jgi:hypothetical protein